MAETPRLTPRQIAILGAFADALAGLAPPLRTICSTPRCGRVATMTINGLPLCNRHARGEFQRHDPAYVPPPEESQP